jgi:hypothetical protein
MYVKVLTTVVITDLHRPAQSPRFKPHPKSLAKKERDLKKSPLLGGDLEGASRAQLFCPAFTGSRPAKTCYAPAATSPMFCPLSPEAYLLTEAVSNMLRMFNESFA